ncbi:MAG: hypothetical protein MUO25_12980, partial [Thermoanaerobaculaceae bacterium]|nr:hypothetical protein [Thermoanaerobaculaceae bacterium]
RRAEMLGLVRVRRAANAYELAFDSAHPRSHPTAMALLAAIPGAIVTPAQVVRLPMAGRDPAADAAELLGLLPQGGEPAA